MRLTKSDKDAFVRAVMDDVPKIDYDEQVRNLMNKWAFEALPDVVKVAKKQHPEYFNSIYVYLPSNVCNVQVVAPPDWEHRGFKALAPEKYAELEVLSEKAGEQSTQRSDLESKVRGLIESCTTLKTATERLPEFVKYLPADRDGGGITSLPVANTVADLMNAGWPKGVANAAAN